MAKKPAKPAPPPAPAFTIKPPEKAANWGVKKKIDGAWVRCRLHQSGQGIDRWPVSTPPTIELIGRTWGRGVYVVMWTGPKGLGLGTSRELLLDDPALPIGSPYPNKPPEAEASPSPASAPTNGQPSSKASMLASLAGKVDAGTLVVLFELVSGDAQARIVEAEQRSRSELDRMRERAKIEAQEDEARFRRTLLLQRQTFEEMLNLKRKDEKPDALEALRAELEEFKASGRGEDGEPSMIEKALEKALLAAAEQIPGAATFIWGAAQEAVEAKKKKTKGETA
jgi:hypothetical protein